MDFDFDSLVLGPCHETFGTSVTYMPRGGAPAFPGPISGVFDPAYNHIEIGEDGVRFSTITPVLGVRDSQAPAGFSWAQDDQLVIASGRYLGQAYVVREAQPDGHGETRLMLNRTA
jgi:hypothetical protein